MLKPATEMRPREILAVRDRTGIALVPVSPAFEWHSYHLPLGTDGLIAETAARLVAERVDGIYFPVLSFGLDEYRPLRQLHEWGFNPGDRVYGMNFPALPLTSEYSRLPEMTAGVGNRLAMLRRCGFRYVFIVNNHGGTGQMAALHAVAARAEQPGFAVRLMMPGDFNSVRNTELLSVGGHAGLSETMLALAFRPDLVDLDELPEGALDVRQFGILHHRPTIEPQWNPRRASLQVAQRVRESIVDQMAGHVRCVQAEARRESRSDAA